MPVGYIAIATLPDGPEVRATVSEFESKVAKMMQPIGIAAKGRPRTERAWITAGATVREGPYEAPPAVSTGTGSAPRVASWTARKRPAASSAVRSRWVSASNS